jgi:hypothetical protein
LMTFAHYAHSDFTDSPGLSRPECPNIKKPASARPR